MSYLPLLMHMCNESDVYHRIEIAASNVINVYINKLYSKGVSKRLNSILPFLSSKFAKYGIKYKLSNKIT